MVRVVIRIATLSYHSARSLPKLRETSVKSGYLRCHSRTNREADGWLSATWRIERERKLFVRRSCRSDASKRLHDAHTQIVLRKNFCPRCLNLKSPRLLTHNRTAFAELSLCIEQETEKSAEMKLFFCIHMWHGSFDNFQVE